MSRRRGPRWRGGATALVVGLALAALHGCGPRKRAPQAALDGCRGSRCEANGGAGGQEGLELELGCELPPEAEALRDQVAAPEPLSEAPATCEEAVAAKSYVGCEFWPTVTANLVASVFDFAVVVANTNTADAEVVVTFRDEEVARTSVAANSISKIYLPWVDELKGSVNHCGDELDASGVVPSSSKVARGAYHLLSDRPVIAYQFNPLEFEPQGGPPDKDWGGCQANSYSNDASLLLPVQAMGTSYYGTTLLRRAGQLAQPTLTITATSDDTTVSVYAPPADDIAPGVGVPPIPAGTKHDFSLDAGDVVQLFSRSLTLSGTFIEADRPVQVISGDVCADVPKDVVACDHLEETVLPARSLGHRYLLAPPTGPAGRPIKYAFQLHAHQDDTRIYYLGDKPRTAPDVMANGEAIFIANVTESFEILATHELSVLLFLQGGKLELNQETDPSQSIAIPVEQFRRRYAFLAPDDYTASYADVTAPTDAEVKLDGKPVSVAREGFPCSLYQVLRIWLDGSAGGVHLLEASEPVGVQVLGHARYTSYQYPGGLNVADLVPAPVHPPVK